MMLRKGAVVILETPFKSESIIVKTTHKVNLVIVGGTGYWNGGMLILKKKLGSRINVYVKPCDVIDSTQEDFVNV